MIDEDKVKLFKINILDYSSLINKIIEERFENLIFSDVVKIEFLRKNKETKVKKIKVYIDKAQLKNDYQFDYSIKLIENIQPYKKDSVITKKYSYEMKNNHNSNDFIRFDFIYDKTYPSYHINSDRNTWGDHLTYPETTNLNLKKLNIFKAVNVFQKYIKHQANHILDIKKNHEYVTLINEEGF